MVSCTVHSSLKVYLEQKHWHTLQIKVRALVLTFFLYPPPKEIVTFPARCVAEGNDSHDSVNSKDFPLTIVLSRSVSLHCALPAKCQLHMSLGKSISLNRSGWFLTAKMGTCLIFGITFFGGISAFWRVTNLVFTAFPSWRANAWLPNCVTRLAASVSSGSLLEIQLLGLYPRLVESETLRVGPRYLWFKKPSG